MLLAEKAAACVEKALNAGDQNIAMAVLRGLGLLAGKPQCIDSDDALDLEIEARKHEERRDRTTRIMSLSPGTALKMTHSYSSRVYK